MTAWFSRLVNVIGRPFRWKSFRRHHLEGWLLYVDGAPTAQLAFEKDLAPGYGFKVTWLSRVLNADELNDLFDRFPSRYWLENDSTRCSGQELLPHIFAD